MEKLLKEAKMGDCEGKFTLKDSKEVYEIEKGKF